MTKILKFKAIATGQDGEGFRPMFIELYQPERGLCFSFTLRADGKREMSMVCTPMLMAVTEWGTP